LTSLIHMQMANGADVGCLISQGGLASARCCCHAHPGTLADGGAVPLWFVDSERNGQRDPWGQLEQRPALSLSFEAHTLREGFSGVSYPGRTPLQSKHTHPRMASFSAVKPTVVTARPTVRALPRHARCRAPVARSMRMFR
jgi:hypothetical protein